MHKRTITTAVIAFVLGLATVAYTQEAHPNLAAAQKLLTEARGHLEKGSHDYGGHRLKAIADIRQAESEIQQALAFDKNDKGPAKKK